MAVRLKQPRPSRTQLRCTRVGAGALIYPEGRHQQAHFEFVKWCAVEPGYTSVAVYAPRKTAPEALENVIEDLASCPGVLRLIPGGPDGDSTLEYGNWLAQRLGRTVVAHEGKVTIVPGGGLYVAPGESGAAGWLRFEPGAAPVAHSRRFPRPGWDCEQFAEPYALGSHAMVEPLPAGAWIRPAGDAPAVQGFRSWLLGGMVPDPLIPRVVLGYPGSPAPPVEAAAQFLRSLPDMLQSAVRYCGFGGTDAESLSYGQRLADVLDASVVLGNGVQVAGPSATGGYEMRTVLRKGVTSWPPYVWDLGYLPARATGGVPADPVAVGHRAPIAGLQEREPGVYEYSHDAVLEVTQSGLWMRPPALPADSLSVRTEQADPAHAKVVFDTGTQAGAYRMQLLATELVQQLEPRVRATVRIVPSSEIGSALRTGAATGVAVLDAPPDSETVPEALEESAENESMLNELRLNLTMLAGEAASTPAPRRYPAMNPADPDIRDTQRIPLDALLASLAIRSGGGSAPANGEPVGNSSWLDDLDDAPVPPAVALYALTWDPDAESARLGADLVSRTMAEVRTAQLPARLETALDDAAARELQPVVEAGFPLVVDPMIEAGAALGTVGAAAELPALVSASAAAADQVVELGRVSVTGSPTVEVPVAPPASQLLSEPAVPNVAPVPFETAPAAVPVQSAPVSATAPVAQFTVARRRQRKGRTVPAVASQTAATSIPAEPRPDGTPAAVRPVPPASVPVPSVPAPTAQAPAPQPVEEPDEPIRYGAFQLVSSSADLSLSAPSVPSAPASKERRPIAAPTPPADGQAPPAAPAASTAPPAPAPPIGDLPDALAPPTASPQQQVPSAPALRPEQPLPVQQPVRPPDPAAWPPAPVAAPVAAPAPSAGPAAPVQPPAQLVEGASAAHAAQPATAAPTSVGRRPARPSVPTVLVQPVPTPQCSVLPREGGLAKERDWLRRNLSKQYDAAASSVARILSEHPGLRAGSSAADSDVLTDLVALRLYLTGKVAGLDAAVRSGQVGPHVPLARCVASGLRRLPSYRGPLRTRAALTEDQIQWYGNRSLVTEWSFLPAVASSNLDLPGTAQILIWSMTARRTGLLDPSRPDQAVFQPGTSFKVLSVETGQDGPEIRLRELTRTEVAPDGAVQSLPTLDEFAAGALEEAGKAWRQVDPVEALPADRRDWFASPPGLLAPAAPAGPAGAAQEGGNA